MAHVATRSQEVFPWPSYGQKFNRAPAQIYAGGAGDVAARLQYDSMARPFPAVPVGLQLGLDAQFVRAAGTSAGGVVVGFDEEQKLLIGEEDAVATGVNVVDEFGVDPTGATETSARIQDAINGTGIGDTLFFPPQINGSPATYLINPDTLVLTGRKWLGMRGNDSNSAARFLANAPGTNLIRVSGAVEMDGLIFDAGGLCTYAFNHEAQGSQLRRLSANNALGYGMRLFESTMRGDSLWARACVSGGILINGCNASVFTALRGRDCDGPAVEIRGGAYLTNPDPTAFSGVCSVFGISAELCGQDGVSPQVRVLGWEGGVWQGAYIEGPTDGVHITEDTHNCTFENLRCIGGAAPGFYGCRIGYAEACLFQNITIANSAGAPDYPTIFCDDTDNFLNNEFYICNLDSRVAPDPVPIRLFNGTAQDFRARNGFLFGSGPPTRGNWRAGQRILSLTSGGGWRCSVSGIPGTWVAF